MSRTKKVLVTLKALFLILTVAKLNALNYYPQFYQPRAFFGEPRLARSWLTSFEFTLRGGHALNGYDGGGHKVNTLNIYGWENIAMIGKNVPQAVLNCNSGCLLNTAWEYESSSGYFGKLGVTGKCSSIEFLPVITQNFDKGFFVSLSIPIKKETVKDIFYKEYTTSTNIAPGLNYIQWQNTINNIEENLSQYHVYVGTSKTSGLGDIQLFGGWTINYEDLSFLDYIDGTIAAGVNFATSKKPSANAPWCLPLGYEGHTGFPLIIAASIGALDWFTLGIQTGAMWFNNQRRLMLLKTAEEQEGWIRLPLACANVNKGTIWHVDEYLKLDHLVGGFSLFLGFSHDHANKTCATPIDQETFDRTIVNSEERLQPWTMTAFHFLFEFDFATFEHPNVPRLSFTIDKVIHGKRVFDSALFGAFVGLDCEW